MNSNTIRYVAALLQLIVGLLALFGKITPAQASGAIGLILSAYHIAQGQFTPATNRETPDNLPYSPGLGSIGKGIGKSLCVALLLCLLCFGTTGCVSGSNPGASMASFVNGLSTNTVTNVSLKINSPFTSHTLTATGLSKTKDGTLQIVNLEDNFAIPLWGFSKTFSVAGVTIEPGTSIVAVPAPTPLK
jgi:hypothetical protein